MALANATLITGTTLSATGGTTVNFAPSGKTVENGVEIIDTGATDFRTRTSIQCRSKMPTYNPALKAYAKGRNFVTFVMPILLADGTPAFPTIRVEVDYHPEQTAAHRLDMRKMAAQILFNASFTQFFETGSKA